MNEETSARERLRQWKALEENPAWKEFQRILQAQADARIAEIILRVDVDIRAQDFARGEESGLKLADRLVSAIIVDLTVEVDGEKKEEHHAP